MSSDKLLKRHQLSHQSDEVILFCDERSGEEIKFSSPERLIIAEQADEFEAAFASLQEAHSNGKYLAGYMTYEAGFLLEPALKDLLPEKRDLPLLCFGVFDHFSSNQSDDRNIDEGHASNISAIYNFQPAWNKEQYRSRFEKLHQHLAKGECFQGNLTFPIEAEWSGDAYKIFQKLAEKQPVGYAGFSTIGNRNGGPIIVSRSPELFFKVDAQGYIETHPMKGTTPRGKTPAEDDAYRDFLLKDEKSQAENRMIVDLLRNDISRISETGTVEVPELFKVERFKTVHQMISKIRAKLLPDLSIQQIFSGLFPCGSIIGAPKISAMRILYDLERQQRGAYCGAMGWIAPDRQMCFNVMIRTLTLFDTGKARFNVGGGVVFDSTAEAEYEECLLKARFVMEQG